MKQTYLLLTMVLSVTLFGQADSIHTRISKYETMRNIYRHYSEVDKDSTVDLNLTFEFEYDIDSVYVRDDWFVQDWSSKDRSVTITVSSSGSAILRMNQPLMFVVRSTDSKRVVRVSNFFFSDYISLSDASDSTHIVDKGSRVGINLGNKLPAAIYVMSDLDTLNVMQVSVYGMQYSRDLPSVFLDENLRITHLYVRASSFDKRITFMMKD